METLIKFAATYLEKLIIKLTPKKYAWASVAIAIGATAFTVLTNTTFEENGVQVELVTGVSEIVIDVAASLLTVLALMLNIGTPNITENGK